MYWKGCTQAKRPPDHNRKKERGRLLLPLLPPPSLKRRTSPPATPPPETEPTSVGRVIPDGLEPKSFFVVPEEPIDLYTRGEEKRIAETRRS